MPIVPSSRRPTALPCLVVLAVLLGSPAWADPLLGRWRTQDHEGLIEVYRCGPEYCGRVLDMRDKMDANGELRRDDRNPDPALRDRHLIGIDILRFPSTPDPRGKLRGSVYNPDSGRTHKCLVWLEEGLLMLRGYVGITLLGRTTAWTRVE